MSYFECQDCGYATTSPRHADAHADIRNHEVEEVAEEES
jgi:hypothetical protein